MPLKTLVKVGSITNLSDARYCAGMGVDLLGFRVIANTENHIEPDLYQQIRGWVSGPKFVAEFYGINESTDVEAILSSFVPDYVELTFQEYLRFKNKFRSPFIVKVTEADSVNPGVIENVAYWVVDSSSSQPSLVQTGRPVLLKLRQDHVIDEVLLSKDFAGISLDGSAELRPGFKDYGDLAEILEKLED